MPSPPRTDRVPCQPADRQLVAARRPRRARPGDRPRRTLTPVDVDVETPLLVAAVPGARRARRAPARHAVLHACWSTATAASYAAGPATVASTPGWTTSRRGRGEPARGGRSAPTRSAPRMETRASITVQRRGALRRGAASDFSCYGHPIRHPLTRRIEGVLDITALSDRRQPAAAAADRPGGRRHRAAAPRRQPGLGEAAARRLPGRLGPAPPCGRGDRRGPRAVQPGGARPARPRRRRDAAAARRRRPAPARRARAWRWTPGRAVTVEVTPVLRGAPRRPAPGGAATSRSRRRRLGARPALDPVPPPAPLLVGGPPGSGPDTRARELAASGAGDRARRRQRPARRAGAGPHAFEEAMGRRPARWSSTARCAPAAPSWSTGIDLLPRPAARPGAHPGRRQRDRPQLVLVSGAGRARWPAGPPRSPARPPGARHCCRCPRDATSCPPSRRGCCTDLEPERHLQLMPSRRRGADRPRLARQPARAPGRARARDRRRWGDAISVKDLPDGYRSDVPDRPLAPLDQAAARRHRRHPARARRQQGAGAPRRSASRAPRSTPGCGRCGSRRGEPRRACSRSDHRAKMAP